MTKENYHQNSSFSFSSTPASVTSRALLTCMNGTCVMFTRGRRHVSTIFAGGGHQESRPSPPKWDGSMMTSQRREVVETTPRNLLLNLRTECMLETEKLGKVYQMLRCAIEESHAAVRQRIVSHTQSLQEYITDFNIAVGARHSLLLAFDRIRQQPKLANSLEAVVKYIDDIRGLSKIYTEWCESVRLAAPHLEIDVAPAEAVAKQIKGLFGESFIRFGDGKVPINDSSKILNTDVIVPSQAKDRKRHKEVFPQPPNRSDVGALPLVLDRTIGGHVNFIKGTEPGLLGCPKAFTIDEGGLIIVADSSNHRIQIFRSDGTFHFSFGYPGPSFGTLNSPFKVVVIKDLKEPSGDAYVVADHCVPAEPTWLDERCNSKIAPDRLGRVQVFSREGVFRRRIVMNEVVRITSLESLGETLFVVDGEQNVVFAFEGIILVKKFCFAGNVAELSEICIVHKTMFACDYRRHSVLAMNMATGKVVKKFGNGLLAFPNGIHADVSAGVIYVADSHENHLRITTFDLASCDFRRVHVYGEEKVSHVVGIKQIPTTEELVVLNRPGKAIRVIAGHVLVFEPPCSDPFGALLTRRWPMPIVGSLLPDPSDFEPLLTRTASLQLNVPEATSSMWDDPPPTAMPSDMKKSQERGGDSARPHKRKSSTKKVLNEDGNADMAEPDQPSPPRIARRSLAFAGSSDSLPSESQGSAQTVDEKTFDESFRAWKLQRSSSCI